MFSRIGKALIGFALLCMIQFLCNKALGVLGIAFPVPILGLVVLFLLLQLNIIKRDWIKEICEFLLAYMPLLFVPLAVGIVAYYGVIEKNLVPILVNVVGTATLTLLVTALFVENVIKFVRLRRIRRSRDD